MTNHASTLTRVREALVDSRKYMGRGYMGHPGDLHDRLTQALADLDALLEPIDGLEEALKDPLDYDLSPGEENIFFKKEITEAARRFLKMTGGE